MNANEANKFPIIDYLARMGISPKQVKPGYCFFISPYREENTPSFKVNLDRNLWVDFGDNNAGGTLIDLVMKMKPDCSVSEAIKEISSISGACFSFRQHDFSGVAEQEKENQGIKIFKTKPLGNNRAITDYLNSRGISLEAASPFCREIYYGIGDKKYFGLANPHENGWAIRNKYWKGCTAQGVSHFKNQSGELCLFEGIFDLLSYVEMKKGERYNLDFMVLNSLANLDGTTPKFKEYQKINLFLDRDSAGLEATNKLLAKHQNCVDKSGLAGPFKDLNEAWINQTSKGVKR